MKVSKKHIGILFLLITLILLIGASPVLGRESEIRVWVEYRGGEKAQVQAAARGMGAQFHYGFDSLNSIVVSLPREAVDQLVKNPRVLSVEEDPVRTLVGAPKVGFLDMVTNFILAKPPENTQVVPYGIDAVQARDIWDANRNGKIDSKAPTGAGRTVCIIDTGFYDEHEDFVGLDVIGGYSQTNDDPGLWTRDGHGHGTHVAGTVNAANNRVGVVGVSPGKASLFIIKIFGDDGLWVSQAHASDLVDAIYRCADAGANITSMSLSGTHPNQHERRAFQALYDQGILHVAAASNDGIEEYHYPASYDSVISVAAVDSNNVVADFSQFNDQVELAAPGVGVLSTIPYQDLSSVTVGDEVFSANHIEYAGRGSVDGPLADGGLCTETGAWTGMVVLCERGDISFYDKVLNVQNSGGLAAVIYNNAPGNFFGTMGEEGDYIIAISLSQEDGQYLVANKLGETGYVDSQYIWPTSGYEAWGGTSMATPHVSGVAALIWSANPGWTNVQIREAMVNTAKDLGDPGYDVHYGHGLVQAKDALDYLKENY